MAKILLIEDDALNCEMITRRLAWEGHTIITATNGVDGLSALEAEQPDLVLMDLGLPVLNGWQTASHIKASKQTSHIPIIALTAYVTSYDYERSLFSGCDDFETKPVNFSRLLTKISALLSEHAV